MIILALLIGVVMVFLLSGCEMCTPHEPIEPNVFRNVMEAEGYEVRDIMAEQEMAPAFLHFLVVVTDNYRFEFAEFTEEEYAIDIFTSMKAAIEDMRGVTRTYRRINLANYSIFEQTSAGNFSYLYRVENTILRVSADVEYTMHARGIIDRIR